MSQAHDEFYVGYLPLPPSHAASVRRAVGVVLVVAAVAAATLSLTHRSGGEGLWDTGHVVTFEGVLHENPYPLLTLDDNSSPVCLVEMGKHGAQERSRGLDGARVRCEGWAITRDGRRILELAPESSAITRLAGDPEPHATEPPWHPATLDGEIVDFKCFLGAMKPGDGKGHKACATLCIDRGIPPVLVTTSDGVRTYTLLSDEHGGPANSAAAPFAGEPVRVSGDVSTLHGIPVMRLRSIVKTK